MVRQLIIPEKDEIKIRIPKDYVNHQIEISIDLLKSNDSNFDKYFGIMNTENLDKEIENLRNEWER